MNGRFWFREKKTFLDAAAGKVLEKDAG